MGRPSRRDGRARRWLWAPLLLLLVAVATSDFSVDAQRVVVPESGESVVVSGEDVASQADDAATRVTTKTVKITRTRVAATIESTRIAGKRVQDQRIPMHGGDAEQCHSEGDTQCVEEPAQAMPIIEQEEEEQETQASPDVQFEEEAQTQQHQLHKASQTIALDMVARHLQELQAQVDVWLPQIQARASEVTGKAADAWNALVAKWLVVYNECAVLYNRFFADAVRVVSSAYHQVAAMSGGVYRQVATVTSDVYAAVSEWVAAVAGFVHDVWETHEEVRIVTRHAVSVALLTVFGALFFSVYAVVATVPDTLSTMWTSLDDITRAQLKIVAVLVTVFAVYQLRELWSFWLLLATIVAFYYWSGHVLAKTPALHRQASRSGHVSASTTMAMAAVPGKQKTP